MKSMTVRMFDARKNKMLEGQAYFLLPSGSYTTVGGGLIHVPLRSTGAADRNGKEIFEGDILVKWEGKRRRGDKTVLVEWTSNKNFTGYSIGSPSASEVIGNIYENPELLK